MPNDLNATAERLARETQILAALEAIPGLALLLNADRRIVHTNSRFLAFLQEHEAARGKRPGDVCACTHARAEGCGNSPECVECPMRMAVLAALNGETFEAEGVWTTESRGGLDVEIHASPIEFFSERFGVVSIRDISRRKELERIRDELQSHMFESAKLTSVGNLAAGMAHEINNPLAIVVGNLGLLAEHPTVAADAMARHRVELALQAAHRVSAIVKNIRAFADRGGMPPTVFDVNHPVQLSVGYFRGSLQAAEVKVDLSLSPESLPASGSVSEFQQAFVQVLSNARDAVLETSDERCIAIGTTATGDEVVVTVRDSGPGMPPRVLDAAFNPFFTTKAPGRGMGLGLTMAQRGIQSLGGKIEIWSEVGKGTLVTMRVPRMK